MHDKKPPHDTARLFLALCPGEEVKAALAAHSDAWQWTAAAARYAPPDWHVTLHFIGPVARHRLDELRDGLAVSMTPFELHLGQAALWPHGLAVLCPAALPEGLQQLHARLGQALQSLGLKTDARPYRPHITLARHAQDAVAPLQSPVIDWPVEGYALMESTGEAAQRYRVLRAYGAAA
jgi:2'-5' RNA ligase